MISIIIPVFYEPYLDKTIDSIFANVGGEIEVIVVLDGWQPDKIDKRVKIINFPEHKGMRSAINAGIQEAKGEFIMKSDAHCLYAKDFDQILIKDFQKNWLVKPRRYSLDEEKWQVKRTYEWNDYGYIAYPYERSKSGCSFLPLKLEKTNDLIIDDTMTFQGSCWLADKNYFLQHIGKLDNKTYAEFGGEQLELSLKYWLGGGEVKVNKNVWYAHLGKRKSFHLQTNKIEYNLKRGVDVARSRELLTKRFLNNEEPNTIYPFEWLIEKFWPVPNWPENWKELVPNIKYRYL